MNRRSLLKTVAALAAAAILPVKRAIGIKNAEPFKPLPLPPPADWIVKPKWITLEELERLDAPGAQLISLIEKRLPRQNTVPPPLRQFSEFDDISTKRFIEEMRGTFTVPIEEVL
jgi:hypothetical protein